jgi:hypothetical protein
MFYGVDVPIISSPYYVQNHRSSISLICLVGCLGVGTSVKGSSVMAADASDQPDIDASTVDAGP